MSEELETPEAAVEPPAPAPGPAPGRPVQPVEFGALPAGNPGAEGQNLDLLLDVQIPVSVEVGRAEMSLDDILGLVPGSVVALDKKAEEPIDLRVNGKLVARGEVVLVDDTYGLRITQILDGVGRLETLRK
ncbi:MAG: flagellar motor switch protein FliN [Planctomycetota bacterium]